MASSSSTSVDKKLETEGSVNVHRPVIESKEVDTAGQLTAGQEITFTPEEAARIRCVFSIRAAYLLVQYTLGGKLTCISCLSCVVSITVLGVDCGN